MDNGPGWLPDPEHEGQERYWDGSDWTDQVRPADSAGSLHRPEHVPELQRALAAATADIDAVEDRLSGLFDRTGTPGGAGAVHRAVARPPGAAADDGVDVDVADGGEFDDEGAYEFDDQGDDEDAGEWEGSSLALDQEFDDEDDAAVDEHDVVSPAGPADDTDDQDDDAFAELDAALAAEAPDMPERRLFRRKS